jgi:hypothetical protein
MIKELGSEEIRDIIVARSKDWTSRVEMSTLSEADKNFFAGKAVAVFEGLQNNYPQIPTWNGFRWVDYWPDGPTRSTSTIAYIDEQDCTLEEPFELKRWRAGLKRWEEAHKIYTSTIAMIPRLYLRDTLFQLQNPNGNIVPQGGQEVPHLSPEDLWSKQIRSVIMTSHVTEAY